MTPDRLLAHFNRIADAPDAISRLRRFILNLAVRGKLVEQDPSDEPAAELLKRIHKEKMRLFEQGEIKKLTQLNQVREDDFLFTIPATWQCVRIAELCYPISSGSTPSQDVFHPNEGVPFLKVYNIRDQVIDFEYKKQFIDAQHHSQKMKRSTLFPGDVVMNIVGPPLGKVAIVPESFPEWNCNQAISFFRPILSGMSEYIYLYLKEGTFLTNIDLIGTAGQDNISVTKCQNIVISLPPLAEQHRIVAKVDELMALCDRLEAAQAERERRRDRLAAASLHRLNNGADAAEFRAHARFHLDHLALFTTRPDQIPALRQTILNLAVRGKLVPQDPNDEPAAELLKRTQTEKERLVKAGEIKKTEPFEPIEADEIKFPIPSGWEVARMGWLARKLGAGSTPLGGKSVYQNEGVPFLRSQNVYNDGLRLDDVALIPRAVHDRMSGTHIDQQDILLNITGASIGRCALVPVTFGEGNVSQHVAIIRLFVPLIREFIHLSLISPFFQKLIDDVQVGVSREGLSMQRLRLFPMPLPPLAEQSRIVAKVEELLALCDQLEAQLTNSQTERRRLLESVLHEALAPAA